MEETIQGETRGDAIYFWARLDMNGEHRGSNDVLTFWSMCDMLNGGNCRYNITTITTEFNSFVYIYNISFVMLIYGFCYIEAFVLHL